MFSKYLSKYVQNISKYFIMQIFLKICLLYNDKNVLHCGGKNLYKLACTGVNLISHSSHYK